MKYFLRRYTLQDAERDEAKAMVGYRQMNLNLTQLEGLAQYISAVPLISIGS